MALLLTVILVALIFEYINGFHDTANSIATVVSTKVLTPRAAILLAAITNLIGALWGTAVAKTISSGLVDDKIVQTAPEIIIASALLGGIIWNLLTWWFGLPSSSTHALVGGLCGAVLAGANGSWSAIIWSKAKAGAPWFKSEGVLYKVILPMFTSPIIGFILGIIVMSLLYLIVHSWRPSFVSNFFGKFQLVSAAYMGFSHGTNDAQKTMGIICLTLIAATRAGTLDDAPAWLHFLRTLPEAANSIPIWIKVSCAITMAMGTAAGGWKIIKTMGHKMVKLQPIHGFAAETTAATVLMAAQSLGMPVSTTHAISTSIMGVGCAKRFSALNLPIIGRILIAWFLTLPVCCLLSYLIARIWLGK
ncbi:MAG TPA: inorganic phosphate transporter [Chthoniobacteraceae bacterium]|jgi:PiT family inorganic phosphate transporter|nr:inorganic phosphate transporter [Chthoniobacteraceae bacterium]